MQEEETALQLKEMEQELLRARLRFMLHWTTLFFHEEHRAVMAYLCHQRQEGSEKVTTLSDPLFWKSRNIDNTLAELKSGFLASVETTKVDREEVKLASANLDFFGVYPQLRRILTEAIKPEYEEVKTFEKNEARERCQSCGTIRTRSQLQHMKEPCECINSRFIVMELKQSKKSRIEKINKMLEDRFFKAMSGITSLEKKVRDYRRRQKEESNRRPNPYDEFLRGFGIEKVQPFEVLRSNNVERRVALDSFGRKPKVYFKEELQEIRRRRRQEGDVQ